MLNDTLGWMLHIDYTNGHYKKTLHNKNRCGNYASMLQKGWYK
jgi:hypothetical protein